MEGRFAKESEFDLVVSLRQGDVFSCLEADDGFGFEAGVETVGLDCADALEKKPKMLFCFPVDDSIVLPFLAVDGVLAGVCLWLPDLSTIAADVTAQIGWQSTRTKLQKNNNAQHSVILGHGRRRRVLWTGPIP